MCMSVAHVSTGLASMIFLYIVEIVPAVEIVDFLQVKRFLKGVSIYLPL